MNNVAYTFAIVVAVAAIAAGTYFQGIETERWEPLNETEELKAMAARLEHIPLEFGEWKGEIEPDTPELLEQYEIAGVAGHTNIRYEHSRTGKSVRVSLVCGHRRHVAIHTPDQCMVGAGFTMLERPTKKFVKTDASKDAAEFQMAHFCMEKDMMTINQRIMWCWSNSGTWIGPDTRFPLAEHRYWFKLYVTTTDQGAQDSRDAKGSEEFIRDFLPVLNPALFPVEEELPAENQTDDA